MCIERGPNCCHALSTTHVMAYELLLSYALIMISSTAQIKMYAEATFNFSAAVSGQKNFVVPAHGTYYFQFTVTAPASLPGALRTCFTALLLSERHLRPSLYAIRTLQTL